MKNGIIMEIKRDILVMMTSEGEFLTGRKQPNQHYTIGEEIPFFPLHHEPARGKRSFIWNWKASTVLLTAIILILTLFSSGFIQSNQAYAYVSVDINPSMELTLNEKQQVIKITPYNQDAKVLLEELDGWENIDVSEVTEEIFLLCEEMGYLKENQNVLITSSFIEDSNGQREDELVAEINKFVQEYSTDHNMNITVKETSQEMREEASDKGMTAGSLLRETEKAETPKPVEDTNKKELKEEDVLKEGIKKEKSSKVENQKVELRSVDKKQKPEGTEKLQKNDKFHSNQKKDSEKPVQNERKNNSSDYQHRNSNDHSNRDEDKYRGNAKWHSPKNSKEENERDQDRKEERRNHNDWKEDKKRDHQDWKDEKKRDHQERKDNKKYKDD